MQETPFIGSGCRARSPARGAPATAPTIVPVARSPWVSSSGRRGRRGAAPTMRPELPSAGGSACPSRCRVARHNCRHGRNSGHIGRCCSGPCGGRRGQGRIASATSAAPMMSLRMILSTEKSLHKRNGPPSPVPSAARAVADGSARFCSIARHQRAGDGADDGAGGASPWRSMPWRPTRRRRRDSQPGGAVGAAAVHRHPRRARYRRGLVAGRRRGRRGRARRVGIVIAIDVAIRV